MGGHFASMEIPGAEHIPCQLQVGALGSQEHLDTPVLPNPCQKEDKQGHSCVYHLKVNLVHVKGAGNTTQTIHNVHFSYTLT